MASERVIVADFVDEVYKSALVLVIGGDRNKYLTDKCYATDEFIAETRDLKCEGMYFRMWPSGNTKGANYSIIWLKEPRIPQLVHELLHFCNQVFEECGVDRSSKYDEAYVYYVEHWLTKIGKRVKCKW